MLMLPVALYALALWQARMANELRELFFARARQRMFRTLSERLFSHVMQLPLRFHLDRKTGALSETLGEGLEGLRILLHHLVFTYVPMTVELAVVLLVLVRFVSEPPLLMFCGALVCYVALFGYSARAVARSARRASGAQIDAAAAITDGLLNYETVKYFAAEEVIQCRVACALRRSEGEWAGFYRRYALLGVAVTAIFGAFVATTALWATEAVQRGGVTLGDFVLVNAYMLQIVRPVEMMGYATQGVSHGVTMVERLASLLSVPTESAGGESTGRSQGPGALEFRDVCHSYVGGRTVLRHISFRVAGGCTLGIVGPSGAGKSTIVRLLMRMLEPESGSILLDDAPISDMTLLELRRSIAVVPQDTVLFDDTLRYNIAVGCAGASAQEIEAAARVARLHELVMTLPHGYDTLVGERGVKLSGGERQRVSIARAILKSPRIYVLDEATSSLDSRTERDILDGLRGIFRGNTTVVIAHRLSTVAHADEIVFLENGGIVERGTHESLLRSRGKYAMLWYAQRSRAEAARA